MSCLEVLKCEIDGGADICVGEERLFLLGWTLSQLSILSPLWARWQAGLSSVALALF
jgi:hypothetical protein